MNLDNELQLVYLDTGFICNDVLYKSLNYSNFIYCWAHYSITHYYYYYLESDVQGRERVRTLYQSKDPNSTQPTHRRKNKIKQYTGDKKERADHANRKALALLLKPASPTPSNTGSLRLFQRDTERVLRYWEVLQRGGENECLWATKAPRVTRAGTYGKGNGPLKRCIVLLLILNSMHNSATDRRWEKLPSKIPLARKPALRKRKKRKKNYSNLNHLLLPCLHT